MKKRILVVMMLQSIPGTRVQIPDVNDTLESEWHSLYSNNNYSEDIFKDIIWHILLNKKRNSFSHHVFLVMNLLKLLKCKYILCAYKTPLARNFIPLLLSMPGS